MYYIMCNVLMYIIQVGCSFSLFKCNAMFAASLPVGLCTSDICFQWLPSMTSGASTAFTPSFPRDWLQPSPTTNAAINSLVSLCPCENSSVIYTQEELLGRRVFKCLTWAPPERSPECLHLPTLSLALHKGPHIPTPWKLALSSFLIFAKLVSVKWWSLLFNVHFSNH